jgi:peptidoglycan hydrolase-like protein with peptidoglycan-binding domain
MSSRLPEICAAYGPRMARDLNCGTVYVAAFLGNSDRESDGFTARNEYEPVVKGSRGGTSWNQWTGPRRRQFEAWCKTKGFDPDSDRDYDEAAYQFTIHELQTTEKAALAAVLATTTVEAAATAVCVRYLRPGAPHLDARIRAAKAAFGYLGGADLKQAPAAPAPQPVNPAEPPAVAVRKGTWPETSLTKFEISAIQQRLLDLGYHVVGFVDGKWGDRTAAALAALQENARGTAGRSEIVVDGHYGPQTRSLLADDANRAVVSVERATVTAKDLSASGNPGVKTGRAITFSSLLSLLPLIGAFISSLTTNWSAVPNIPWPFSMVLNVLPPWAMLGAVIVFNVYNAAKATGLIGASVQRVREGIDNTGAPQQGSISLPFGLDKLIPR